jgi:formylglycine-generating enzyme required for sulfatase activity
MPRGRHPRRIAEGVSIMVKRIAGLLGWLLIAPVAGGADYIAIPSGAFVSALAVDGTAARIAIRPFAMRVEPVTNAEYLDFVRAHPEWQRGRVSPLFAGPQYLSAWQGPLTLGPGARPDQPVTGVSWFAARAYCASERARLPDWYEWEYVAAADATHRDARRDPLRNQALLSAIQDSTGERPGAIGRHPANVWGVRDLNRLLWEWTGDYAAMFPDADARVPGAGASLALCGGSALAFADKNQFALMMRVAALVALKPADAAPRVGFRCVRDLPGE